MNKDELKDLYPDLRIIEFQNQSDKDDFKSFFLESKIAKESSQKILDLLLPLSNCIIEENNYVDQDFLDSYGRFYVYAFKNFNRGCTRFHFFRGKVTIEDIFGCKDIENTFSFNGNIHK